MNDLETKLYNKGWTKTKDGWSAPSRRPVGGLQDPKPEHREIQTLASGVATRSRRKSSLVYRCCIVSCRKSKLADSDNLSGGGAKALRDAIASTLGIDDSDCYIEWTYEQIVSKTEGTLVLLTKL